MQSTTYQICVRGVIQEASDTQGRSLLDDDDSDAAEAPGPYSTEAGDGLQAKHPAMSLP